MGDANRASHIKDIVNNVISRLSSGAPEAKRVSEDEIKKIWAKAAGAAAGRRSRPVSLRKGKLVINVRDSSLLYNLTLRKREILEVLKKGLGDRVRDIQFRIGDA